MSKSALVQVATITVALVHVAAIITGALTAVTIALPAVSALLQCESHHWCFSTCGCYNITSALSLYG